MSQDTMYMNVSADSSSVTIVGLDGSLVYSVQVSAGTRAGQAVQSTAVLLAGVYVFNIASCTSHISICQFYDHMTC